MKTSEQHQWFRDHFWEHFYLFPKREVADVPPATSVELREDRRARRKARMRLLRRRGRR